MYESTWHRLGMSEEEYASALSGLYHIDLMGIPDVERKLGTCEVWQHMKRFDIPTRSLSEGKYLARNRELRPKEPIPPTEIEALDGLLLSDGYLDHSGANARLRLCFKHAETIEAAIRDIPFLGVSKPKPTEYYDKRFDKTYQWWWAYSHRLPQLTEQHRRWYPNGKKRVPQDITLTQRVLYWWYIGDGSNPRGKYSELKFCTGGFTEKDVHSLAHSLYKLGLHPRVRKDGSQWNIHLPRRDKRTFFGLIGPCRNPEYVYKWPRSQSYVIA